MTNGIEKFIEEMEKEKVAEKVAEDAKTEKGEKKIEKGEKKKKKKLIERKEEKKDREVPSGWSEDYYGIKRDGPAYRSRKRIIITEDSAGVIRETVE